VRRYEAADGIAVDKCDREGAKSAKEGAKKRRREKIISRKRCPMDVFHFHARQDSGVAQEIENLAFAVIGAAIEVHREFGPGLSEVHYKRAMSHELTLRGIPHSTEADVDVLYKGVSIGTARIDLLVGEVLIVELKAVETLTQVHRSQAITYLKLKRLSLALLINFNVTILRDGVKRVINTQ
jgi:GxxExxY protein